MPIERYNKREPQVFVWVMLPYVIFMNLLVFGSCIFSSFGIFAKSTFYSLVYFSIIYFVFGTVAIWIRNKYSGDGELFKRIRIMLPLFYIMNIGAVNGLYYLFQHLPLVPCTVIPNTMWWAILYGCIMSTAITFMNEGIANWEKWKASLAEAEKLKSAYQRSRLLGLKGQINPHFLFNCFNTLSGLIQEEEEKAELFLNEMTKVHRYLLRSDEAMLVSVADEIKFAESYLWLTKSRFGNAVIASICIDSYADDKMLPPLSMQAILENIIYTNAINKNNPLNIRIYNESGNMLHIEHSVHEKTIIQNLHIDEGLDNLLNKYVLLNSQPIEIKEEGDRRTILLPLFKKEEVSS